MAAGGHCSSGNRPQPIRSNGRFEIPWPGFRVPGVGGLLKFMATSKDESNIPRREVLDSKFPVHPLNKELLTDRLNEGLKVTWIGHATVLVQMDDINILTDPVFSHRCGPVQMLGVPLRYRNPPCTIDELPRIDAVVISHNHYDHLDNQSVVRLNQRFGDELRWFVPSGLRSWMHSAGCQNVIELSWWDEHQLGNVRYVCVPSQHWSKRSAWDDNRTLWGGWCVIGPRCRFYFAGDTGYNANIFKQIGDHYGPFDLAALPIGAYNPRWFMQCQHVDPDEAWQIHKDVRAFNSLGIHWGTFKLSNEYYLEPRERIDQLQHGAEKEDGRRGFFTTDIGETVLLNCWTHSQQPSS